MATLTIRGLDDETRARLRIRAARHGRSMEAEVRSILREAVTQSSSPSRLGSRIHSRFAGSDVVLQVPERTEAPRAAAFDS